MLAHFSRNHYPHSVHPSLIHSPAIGIIGGTGLYEMQGLEEITSHSIHTPFGEPSDKIIQGQLGGRRVCFLPRHGVGHRFLPHEINYRANIWALRSLDVRWLISVTAVGSLREHIAPRDIVIPDQLIDRTGTAAQHTFFGNGIAAHIGFADPYCEQLRKLLIHTSRLHTQNLHARATYLCMNGPAFSTRAEAAMHRILGADIIGMTNGPEARLCREAEIATVTMALATDYDCWKLGEPAVEVHAVIENLRANSAMAKSILRDFIPKIPLDLTSACHRSLDTAIFTPLSQWPAETTQSLGPILNRFL